MIKQADIHHNISTVLKRISQAASAAGRSPDEVRLVAVGKTQSTESIGHAIASGAQIIGENYIQEAREKFDALFRSNIQWHFIGRLQSNKAKYAVRMFDLIHSVGTLKLARELDKQALKAGKKQHILVQVNVSGESSKSGIELQGAARLVQDILPLENLHLRGLMTMPPFFDAPDKARPYFSALRRLRDRMTDQLGIALPELSMGMTGDFEVAIEEGATLVRIGTALFGERR
ncbi:MAG: YggS family pyridoxal phosphate-dependent enzyme [Desulfobacteraceae bacterium]|jgi:pyridoxal phosphate enzyme (YggS family)